MFVFIVKIARKIFDTAHIFNEVSDSVSKSTCK